MANQSRFLRDHKPRIQTERIYDDPNEGLGFPNRKAPGHTAYWFCYRIPIGGGDHMGFKFSILAECRDDMQEYFRNEMFRRGLLPRVVEIDCSPWLITVGDHIGELVRKEHERKTH